MKGLKSWGVLILLFIVSVNGFGIRFDNQLYQNIISAVDYNNDKTWAFARRIISENPEYDKTEQIIKIFRYVNENWKDIRNYTDDNVISKASISVESNLSGDDMAFAVLLSALIESIGGRTRINIVFDERDNYYIFTEVDLGTESYDNIIIKINEVYHPYLYGVFNLKQIKYVNIKKEEICSWLNLNRSEKYPGERYPDYYKIIKIYPKLNLIEEDSVITENIRKLYSDDFSDATSTKWIQGDYKDHSFNIKEDNYNLKSFNNDDYILSINKDTEINPFNNYEIKTLIKFEGNSSEDYGVVWDYVDESNFHFFKIRNDGTYAIGRKERGEYLYATTWKSICNVNYDDYNKIQILKQENHISIVLNNRFIERIRFYPFYGNQFGFSLGKDCQINVKEINIFSN